jgi:hypothetical protein
MKEVANGHADNEAGRLAASLAQASAAVSEPNATGAPGEAGASVSSETRYSRRRRLGDVLIGY